MTKKEKRIEWKARFDSWKRSGLSVAEWCREEGIKDHQMYYWIQCLWQTKNVGNGIPFMHALRGMK